LLSIIVINDNKALYLDRLFSTMNLQQLTVKTETIVVDNASFDESTKVADRLGADVVVVAHERSRNIGELYELGAQAAQGEYLLFVKSDSFFANDFFTHLEPMVKGDQVFHFVNFTQCYVDGQVFGLHQLGYDELQDDIHYRQLFQNLPHGIPYMLQCSESCFMVRKEAVIQNHFESNLFHSFYDFALLNRILYSGGTIRNSNAVVYHYFLDMTDKLETLSKDKSLFLETHKTMLRYGRLKELYIQALMDVENLQVSFETAKREWNDRVSELESRVQKERALVREWSDRARELEAQVQVEKAQVNKLNNRVLDLEAQVHEEKEQVKGGNERIIQLKTKLEFGEGQIREAESGRQQLLVRLQEIEYELERIKHSNGWRVLIKYYKLRDTLIPPKSKRRLFLKLVRLTVRQPRKMFSHLHIGNVRKFGYYLRTEELNILSNRIDNFLDRHDGEEEATPINLIPQEANKRKLIFPTFDRPRVSIVIPVYNQWDFTYSCLRSVLEHTEGVAFEVIVADDVSTDETTKITSYIENITVVRDDKNRGFLLNCNHAAAHARGEFIFFLNNDTNVQPGWLSSLVRLMEEDASIGMAGSKLVYPDGRLQEAGGIIWKDASGWNFGRLSDPEKSEFNYVKDVDYISGAAIMIRTEIWKKLGGFDPRYVPAYCEDSDLAFEVRKLGYRVVLQPASVVVHFEGISHGTDTSSGTKSYQLANKEKFIEKWRGLLERDHFPNGEHVFLARDRSRHKKTILVIDHYVPHFDKDAGSRTIFQYLTLFCEMGYNVKFVGDNFFRHEPYTSVLQQMGIEVLYGEWYAKHIKDWLRDNGEYIDVVFLNRPHISVKYIDHLRRYTRARIIYYGHDLHYLREEREYQLTGNRALLNSAAEWKRLEFELMKKADITYYPSQVEVDAIQREEPSITAKAIPAYIYGSAPNGHRHVEDTEHLMFVGGFGHKPNIDAVLWFGQEIFPAISGRKPELKLYIVGSNPPDDIKALASKNIIVTGYVSDDELENYYRTVRMVVVPLRYGAGVKGKVVEAMYHQCPIVTSGVGAEGLPEVERYVEIADDAGSFIERVLALYDNTTKLAELSAQSGQYVRRYFSKESVLRTIHNDFEKREVPL